MGNTIIFITTQKSLIHNYPNAPQSVAHLRNLHRHMFHFKVSIEVFNNDRDVEFLLFKTAVEEAIDKMIPHTSSSSCERMADLISADLIAKYPQRQITIEVSEDGENGAIKTYANSRI